MRESCKIDCMKSNGTLFQAYGVDERVNKLLGLRQNVLHRMTDLKQKIEDIEKKENDIVNSVSNRDTKPRS